MPVWTLDSAQSVHKRGDTATPQAGIPQGCFFASGIQQVELGEDTCHIGHQAFECCKLLTLVNLAKTGIHTLHMHTFAQCPSLDTIMLPICLREIRAEVFAGCKSLASLTLPSGVRYIGYRAFGHCTELSCLEYARNKDAAPMRPIMHLMHALN